MTTAQYVQLNNGGSMARFSILEMAAFEFNRNRPLSMAKSWRDVRSQNFKNSNSELNQGLNNDNVPIWYTQSGEYFRNEQFCDLINKRIGHFGHWCDEDCNDKARGIVAQLPHNKYIAGYLLSSNDERVYFGEIFTDETEAALAADEHARVIAELQIDDSIKFNEYRAIEDTIENACNRLQECLALRNNKKLPHMRRSVASLISTIRYSKDKLLDYSEFM